MPHGNQWAAIHEDEESMLAQVKRLVAEGRLPELQPETVAGGVVYRYIVGPDSSLTAAAIVRYGESENVLESAFPSMLDLAECELEVFSTDAVKDEDYKEVEGVVTAITQDGAEVTFFCPAWLAVRETLEAGGRFKFGLGALAYSLEAAPQEIIMTEGSIFEREKKRQMEEDPQFDSATFTSVSVQTGNLRTFFARDDGDIEFQSPVEEVIPFDGLGTSGYVMLVNLAPEGRQRIAVKLYATAKVLGNYTPAPGDSVRGVAWMQGLPLERVEAEDSWLDSAEAARGSGDGDLMIMISYMFDNPHLPLALQAVGGAILGAGWDLLSVEDKLFRAWAPAFHAQRKGVDFWFFIRTAITGFCEAGQFGADREKCESYAAERNIRCLWVTVTLLPMGKNYAVSCEGLEEFADELRLPLEVARPERTKIVSIGTTPREPEPVFDEARAACIFADCINGSNLNELSKLLVEDLQYVSDAVKVTIQGRHRYLSYMGTRLDQWLREGEPVSAETGTIVHAGASRPCVTTFSSEGKAVACTIFTVIEAHIAAIHTLSPDSPA